MAMGDSNKIAFLEGQVDSLSRLLAIEKSERMRVFTETLKLMTNGEWDELKNIDPKLHAFVKQAVAR